MPSLNVQFWMCMVTSLLVQTPYDLNLHYTSKVFLVTLGLLGTESLKTGNKSFEESRSFLTLLCRGSGLWSPTLDFSVAGQNVSRRSLIISLFLTDNILFYYIPNWRVSPSPGNTSNQWSFWHKPWGGTWFFNNPSFLTSQAYSGCLGQGKWPPPCGADGLTRGMKLFIVSPLPLVDSERQVTSPYGPLLSSSK